MIIAPGISKKNTIRKRVRPNNPNRGTTENLIGYFSLHIHNPNRTKTLNHSTPIIKAYGELKL